MTSRIVVTGGAIIRDDHGRILLQRRSDYGDWGLPHYILRTRIKSRCN
ncbi:MULTISPECIES: hypothetical protein [Paenibacillus]|nr:hypothetical protein [Paenibacillus illinoisensis]MCM3204825.1 hypothetical protein [Paenibacillus illinoisensis]